MTRPHQTLHRNHPGPTADRKKTVTGLRSAAGLRDPACPAPGPLHTTPGIRHAPAPGRRTDSRMAGTPACRPAGEHPGSNRLRPDRTAPEPVAPPTLRPGRAGVGDV